MFRTLLLSLFCSFPILLSAQVLSQTEAQKVVHGSETVRISPETGTIEYIRFQPNQRMTLQELVAKKQPWMPAQFQPSDFRPLRVHEDRLGMRHHRYQVTQAGIPIEGAVIIVHEKDGKVVSLNGEMYTLSSPVSTQPISESTAWRNALTQIGDSENKRASTQWSYLEQHPSPGTLVYAPKNGDFKLRDFRLAWKFDLYLTQPLYRSWVYVDAQTGEVIWESNRIHTSDVQATAVTKYSGNRTITTDSLSPMVFELFETGRGGGITTRNMLNGFSIGNSVPFMDTDNYWNNVNANQDEVATDAHLGAEITYDYYLNTYGWNSFDNQGSRIRSYVHFSVGYENAYWDGVNVVYGDGGGGTFSDPLACPEICGHEITHGVTEFSAGLIYVEEFGALNESFSDIFGTVIEAEFYPSSWDWNIGGQVTPNAQGIRNMQDPTLHGDPDCYGGPLWINGADVHFNSGVQNKWFYILTAGEADTNAFGNVYNVTGIGMQKAAAIAFRNLTTYLTPTSTYSDARFYAIESAKDLYGNCSAEMIATADAWYAVGVGQPYLATPSVSFSAYPPSVCSLPAEVVFSNTSSPAAAYFWDFGDGNTDTTASPVHTYTNYGLYTVKLVVEGCTGIQDSVIMTDLIHVDTNAICPVVMDSVGIDTLTNCEGILLDPGGQFNYPNEVSSTVVIAPPNATNLRLTFTDFGTENNFDFLSVFDGPSTSSPLIGRYSGANLPNGGMILSSGPEVTILFTSDVITVDEGFAMEWECISAADPPIADFHTSFPVSCTGQMAFYDQSIGTINTWNWDFGDGSTSTAQNPIHTYTANGTYTIGLEVCNGAGCDTLIKNALVTVNLGSSACDTSLFPSIGRYTYIDCQGFLMDDGGSNFYSSSQNTTVVISPPGATGIQLDFSQFSTEWNSDYLYIYDGPSNQSPIIGFYTGPNLPQGGTIRSSGGAITLNFRASQFGIEEGFALNWKSFGSTVGPNAAFTAPDTIQEFDTANFTDQSSSAVSWNWDFGNGNTGTGQSVSEMYNTPGTYTVILEVTDAAGCADTAHHTLVVDPEVSIDPAGEIGQLFIWPNPTREEVNVQYSFSGTRQLSWSLTDMMGRSLYQQQHRVTDGFSTQVKVSTLAKGIYFLKVESAQGSLVRKVVIE